MGACSAARRPLPLPRLHVGERSPVRGVRVGDAACEAVVRAKAGLGRM